MSTGILPFRGNAARSLTLPPNKINAFDGPYGVGKTFVSVLAFLAAIDSPDLPDGDIVLVGNSEKSLRRNVYPELEKLIGRGAIVWKQDHAVVMGRTWWLFGANNEQAKDRIAGMNVAAAYVDEASRLVESMFDATLARLRHPNARMYATTNPAAPMHWLYRRFIKDAGTWLDPDGVLQTGGAQSLVNRYSLRPHDNPWIGPEYWANLARTLTGADVARYVRGEWVAAEGAIYPHTLDRVWRGEVPRMQAYHLGLDYGTSNPFAVLLIGEGIDRRAYVLEELYHDGREQGQRSDEEYVQMVRAWLLRCHAKWPGCPRPQRFVSDPSAASMLVALRRHGFAATSGDNSVNDGIRWVGSLLATDHLRFLPHVTHTIDEHANYLWDEKKAAEGKDEPLKENDHCPDSLRYISVDRQRAWRGWMGLFLQQAA